MSERSREELQTIQLTRPAAMEVVAEVCNQWVDWKTATIAEFATEIVKKLGFR